MSRRLRWIEPNSLVEITDRCFQGRFLLRPSPELNSRIVGVFARAKELYPVKLHDLSVMSNHWHAKASCENAKRLANFMGFVKTNVSKEAGRLHDWKGSLWAGRYHSTPITEQPSIQIHRLEYVLSQGCKEGLVASPYDWPGINSAKAIVEGKPLKGVWYDRSKEYAAKIAGIEFETDEFATEYELHFDPLPCWAHLEPEEYQRRVAEIVTNIEQETAKRHQRNGTQPFGSRKVCRQSPHQRPSKLDWSIAPLVHAATKKARFEYFNAYQWFVVEFRRASARLLAGDRFVEFPEGSFPPNLPWVPG